MDAVIDVGSNTIRMIIAGDRLKEKMPPQYYRQITRLGGDFSEVEGLSESGICRSLEALKSYQKIISSQNISRIKVVGTAALRRAGNRQDFIDRVFAATGLKLEIIDGVEEAFLATQGVLSVVVPIPDAAIIVDIGGGSTELTCIIDGQIHFQQSFPLGVVRLCEEFSSAAERRQQIEVTFNSVSESLQQTALETKKYQLIGTAGTITTLAAIHLRLRNYDAEKINNHEISIDWLYELQSKLESMSVAEREALIGMEPGRGDLILPGLEIILFLLDHLQISTLRVSDAGLLEGLMINLTDS
jgi:exopolyphosphatase / guanosine-5'-triphosphate,3'-diphosphate pyrophosphatase